MTTAAEFFATPEQVELTKKQKKMSTKQLIASARKLGITREFEPEDRELIMVMIAGVQLEQVGATNTGRGIRQGIDMVNAMNKAISAGPFGLNDSAKQQTKALRMAEAGRKGAATRAAKKIEKVAGNASLTDAEVVEMRFLREVKKMSYAKIHLAGAWTEKIGAGMVYEVVNYRSYKNVARVDYTQPEWLDR